MEGRRKIPTKNAVHWADGTAKDKLRSTSYLRTTSMSRANLKEQIGELLFCLEFPVGKELSRIGWGLFERQLRQYVDLRLPSQSIPDAPESKKQSREVQ